MGLKEAGFRVVAAVENEMHAYATYKANHPEVAAFHQDICTVSGRRLKRLAPEGQVDLLVGCPPCQGFSSLTSKYKRMNSANELVAEMGRLAAEVRPRAVMMENVPRMTTTGKPLLEQLTRKLKRLGYRISVDILQVADYGVPQFRRRLVLLAGRGFAIPIPRPTHSKAPKGNLKPWRTVREAIGGMTAPMTFAAANEKGGVQRANWHVVRTLSEVNKKRLKHTRPGDRRSRIPNRLRPDCHKDLNKGFINVYGRMEWDNVAPTITGGCCTLSKGRFGHPSEDRTISVREAALLQSFPSDYLFDTPYMEYVTKIIGNALPCDFAEAVARACAIALKSRA